MQYNPVALRIANYHYGEPGHIARLEFQAGRKKRHFIVGIASAYNAYGLIGSECNGIFVLDFDKKNVVLDEHCKQSSGWRFPPQEVWQEFKRICEMSFSDFRQFVADHPRTRQGI